MLAPVTITQVQVALSGAIPALVAMWLVDRLDRKRPEPARTRRLAALFGMLSVIPAIAIELGLGYTLAGRVGSQLTYEGATIHAFVIAAAVEEACKFLVIYWFLWRRPEVDERMDGIVYASRAGLGFALVENVMYLLWQPSLTGQLTTWVLRAFLAVPGHALWSGMIGALAARRRFDGKGLGLLWGYLLAVAFHGLYDLAIFVQQPMMLEGHAGRGRVLLLVPIALTVLAFLVVRSMARTALHLDDADAARRAAAHAVRLQEPAKP